MRNPLYVFLTLVLTACVPFNQPAAPPPGNYSISSQHAAQTAPATTTGTGTHFTAAFVTLNHVHLKWTAPSGDSGYALSGSSDGVTFQTIATLPPGTTSYDHTLLNRKLYYYRLAGATTLSAYAVRSPTGVTDGTRAQFLFGTDDGGLHGLALSGNAANATLMTPLSYTGTPSGYGPNTFPKLYPNTYSLMNLTGILPTPFFSYVDGNVWKAGATSLTPSFAWTYVNGTASLGPAYDSVHTGYQLLRADVLGTGLEQQILLGSDGKDTDVVKVLSPQGYSTWWSNGNTAAYTKYGGGRFGMGYLDPDSTPGANLMFVLNQSMWWFRNDGKSLKPIQIDNNPNRSSAFYSVGSGGTLLLGNFKGGLGERARDQLLIADAGGSMYLGEVSAASITYTRVYYDAAHGADFSNFGNAQLLTGDFDGNGSIDVALATPDGKITLFFYNKDTGKMDTTIAYSNHYAAGLFASNGPVSLVADRWTAEPRENILWMEPSGNVFLLDYDKTKKLFDVRLTGNAGSLAGYLNRQSPRTRVIADTSWPRPAPPAGLSAVTPDPTHLTLKWLPTSLNEDRFRIVITDTSDGAVAASADGIKRGTTACSFENLLAGHHYSAAVTAYQVHGMNTAFASSSVAVQMPSLITSFNASTIADNAALTTWTMATNPSTRFAMTYVDWADGKAVVQATNVLGLSYTFGGFLPGHTYTLYVQAYQAETQSIYSTSSAVIQMSSLITNFIAGAADSTTADVTWQAATNPTDHFSLYYWDTTTGVMILAAQGVSYDARYFRFANLAPGHGYGFRVEAYQSNSAGWYAAAQTSLLMPPAPPPPPPPPPSGCASWANRTVGDPSPPISLPQIPIACGFSNANAVYNSAPTPPATYFVKSNITNCPCMKKPLVVMVSIGGWAATSATATLLGGGLQPYLAAGYSFLLTDLPTTQNAAGQTTGVHVDAIEAALLCVRQSFNTIAAQHPDWGVFTTYVAAQGGSSGAHVVGDLGTRGAWAAMSLWAGPTDMAWLYNYQKTRPPQGGDDSPSGPDVDTLISEAMNGAPGAHGALDYTYFSPALHVGSNAAAVLWLGGTSDKVVPLNQGWELGTAYSKVFGSADLANHYQMIAAPANHAGTDPLEDQGIAAFQAGTLAFYDSQFVPRIWNGMVSGCR